MALHQECTYKWYTQHAQVRSTCAHTQHASVYTRSVG